MVLGATAGKALLGSKFTLGASRGREIDSGLAPHATATTHPSAILRQRDDESRHAAREAFQSDLSFALALLKS